MLVLIPALFGLTQTGAPQPSQQPREAKPAFSIRLSVARDVVEVGSPLMLRFVTTNTSDHDIFLERGSLSIVDSVGRPVPRTSYGEKIISAGDRSRLGPLPLHPGGAVGGRPTDLNAIYDLSKPGTYTIQAKSWDQYSRTMVESNVLTLTLTPPPIAPERTKASFRLYINTDNVDVSPGSRVPVNMLVTNTSDHEIVYDTATTKIEIEVRDARGGLATLTEGGRSRLRYLGTPGSSYNRSPIGAGDTLAVSAEDVGVLYDLRGPGKYTVQVSRFDNETKTWVKSNTITLTVTP